MKVEGALTHNVKLDRESMIHAAIIVVAASLIVFVGIGIIKLFIKPK